MSKARSLSAFISDPAIDASEIGSNAVTTDKILDSAVTHTKLHTDMNLTSKTVTFADNHISGNKIHGGVISDFASIGIDDNASSTAITIFNSGNVGVGTTSDPLVKFQAVQSANEQWAGDFKSTGVDAYGLRVDMSGSTGTKYALGAYTAAGTGLFLLNDGKLGIGTNSPDLKLHVDGSNGYPAASGNTPVGHIAIRAKNESSSHGAHIGVADASPWGTWFQAQDAGNLATNYPLLLNPNGGNVGIGTTNPSSKLEVTGTISSTGSSYSVNATGANFGFYNGGAVPITYVQMPLGGAFQVWTPGTSGVLTVKDNGNVGIGLDNPVTKLQVNGNMLSQKVFVGDYNSNGTSARQVIGWYQISGNSNTTYRHLRTTLWGGGSPNGNFDYIMGGFHIQSYRYVQSAGQSDAWITFHNWSGSVQNGYNYVYYGNWDAGSYAYVDSTGYVTLRVSNGIYHAHHIDLHQFPIYPVRDIRVSAVIDSSSATI